MLDLDRLRVSLTKNGYMKIAEVLKRHPRWEVLDNIHRQHPGIKLARSQVANILGEDLSGEVPEFWDAIRSHGDRAIEAFVFVAIVMSHVDLIRLLISADQGEMKGCIDRGEIGEKAYTNLIYAMASCGLCDYERGAQSVNYDMRPLLYDLRDAGEVVRQLIEFKLRTCGWRAAGRPDGTDFFAECEENKLHRVFGLEPAEFRKWLQNRLKIKPPTERGKGGPRKPR